jgi:uncharacterized protein DUF4082
MTDVYAWDSGPSAPTGNDPSASGIFGDDFSSSVAGQITAVFWWRPASGGHTTVTAQVHLQSDQSLITTEASGTLTAGAVNRIALSSPVTVTTGVKYTVSAFCSVNARLDFENPSTDRTVSGVTAYGSGGRFKNIGFSVGDYPTSSDPGTGFSIGIEFTPSAAAPDLVAGPQLFSPGMIAPTGQWVPWLGVPPVFPTSTVTGSTAATATATVAAVKVVVVTGRAVGAAIVTAAAVKVLAVSVRAVAAGVAADTARKVCVTSGRGVAVPITTAAALKRATPAGFGTCAGAARVVTARVTPASGRTVAAVTAVAVTGASGAGRPGVGRVVAVATTRCRARFIIVRPNTGVIARPNTGTVARPNAGVVERP